MAYAVWQDMVDRFGASEMQRLDHSYVEPMPDAEPPVAEDYPGVATALEDVSAMIDSCLAFTFDLPLSGTFPALTAIVVDLARARLWDDDESDAVAKRTKMALERLDAIAGGNRVLVSSAGDVVQRRALGSVVSPTRLFGDRELEGF